MSSSNCVRVTSPEKIIQPTTISIGSTHSRKMTLSKETDHTCARSESAQNIHSDYSENFHKSV